jgi:hypothetical protein
MALGLSKVSSVALVAHDGDAFDERLPVLVVSVRTQECAVPYLPACP